MGKWSYRELPRQAPGRVSEPGDLRDAGGSAGDSGIVAGGLQRSETAQLACLPEPERVCEEEPIGVWPETMNA